MVILNGDLIPFTKATENITSGYTISAQFCTPANPSARNTTVQIMTHEIGLDKKVCPLPP
jgi:hypothetical protein